MSEALFLRLLPYEDKSSVLAEAIAAIHDNHTLNSVAYVVDPTSFSKVPDSPFAYWVSEHFRQLFIRLPSIGNGRRTIKQGIATADDFRFVRTWWEVTPKKIVTGTPDMKQEGYRQQTFEGKGWVPFAKGGVYSPYYSDLHLVVNWERDGEDIRNFKDPQTGKLLSRPQNTEFYFHPGLTWSDRTTKLFSARPLPAGSIFSVKGSAGFFTGEELYVLGIMNSLIFNGFLSLLVGAGDAAARYYQVGVIGTVPFMTHNNNNSQDYESVKKITFTAINLKRSLDITNETSHIFHLPAVLQITRVTLVERINAWQRRVTETEWQLDELQYKIDSIAFHLYDIEDSDRHTIEESLGSSKQIVGDKVEEDDSEEGNAFEVSLDAQSLLTDLLSYTVGCVYGRWDICFAISERPMPTLPDPFAPLPACSPGMLTGNDGLPLDEVPPEYPLIINWEGILVDDPDHPDDIVRRVRDVLGVIWKDNAEAIEQEACHLLGVKELRDYFRRPGNDGFWMDHVRRYSKSRRKAPIYWLLQSSKRNYALWLYYHRLDKDILFKALTNYVEPKLRLEESRLAQLRAQLTGVGSAGREVKQLERQIERQEGLMAELYDFRDKLRHAADLQLAPDLNDGVVLNIAPLWELVPWSEARKYWEELRAGKYEWSSIGKQLRERKVI